MANAEIEFGLMAVGHYRRKIAAIIMTGSQENHAFYRKIVVFGMGRSGTGQPYPKKNTPHDQLYTKIGMKIPFNKIAA